MSLFSIKTIYTQTWKITTTSFLIIWLIYRGTFQDNNGVDDVVVGSTQSQNVIIKEEWSNNFEFPLNVNDTIFTLTRNNSIYKEGVGNVISKIFTLKVYRTINLDHLSKALN